MYHPKLAKLARAVRRTYHSVEEILGLFTVSTYLQVCNYILLVCGGIAVPYLWLLGEPNDKKTQILIAIGSVLFGMATVLGLIQVVWLRRRIEFSTFSQEMFLTELYKVLTSVQPKSHRDTMSTDADFYYLCNVHDPCLPELSGQSACSLFVTEFCRVLNDPNIRKQIAIAAPEPVLFEMHNVPLGPQTRQALGDSGSLLDIEQHYIRWITRISNKKDSKFAFDKWLDTSDTTTLDDLIKPNQTRDRSADESGAYHRYKECAALFREAFTIKRETSGPDDTSVDLVLCGLKYPKMDIIKPPDQMTSINIFCSRTRGLLIFFDFFAYPYYSIEAMPLHNTKFLRELILLFDAKTRDSVLVHLRKTDSPRPKITANPETADGTT